MPIGIRGFYFIKAAEPLVKCIRHHSRADGNPSLCFASRMRGNGETSNTTYYPSTAFHFYQ